MNHIVVVSLFRNAESYIQNYFDQMIVWAEMMAEKGYTLSLVLGYGDCTDNTEALLRQEAENFTNCTLVDVSHGGENYGSIVHPERFRQLSKAYNSVWSLVPEQSAVVVMVESDLEWQPETMDKLVQSLQRYKGAKAFGSRRFIIAPLVLREGDLFYDTWAFRKNKTHLQNQPPYHPLFHPKGRFSEMDSVGSCLVMSGNFKHLVHFPEKDVVVGFCRMAREEGAEIYIDRECKVYHP